MKRLLSASALILFIVQIGFTQSENQLSVSTVPYGTIPMGSSSGYFNMGFGAEASVAFIPAFLRFLGLGAGSDLISLPLDTQGVDSESSIWAVSVFAGPVFRLPLDDRLSIFADGKAGYYYWGPGGWDSGNSNGGGVFAGGGAGVLFRVAGPFTLGAGASYDYYSELYHGLNVNLAVRLDFPGLEKETGSLEIREIRLMPLFPVLYSYYDNHPIGTAVIMNTGKTRAEDASVEFFVERYMDNPMSVGATFSLYPGEEKTVDLYAVFSDELMEVTEGTKVSAKVSVSYPGRDEVFIKNATGVLEFYNRNAMTWDDDAKVASFITAKDPEVMNFAKNVVTWMQDVKNPALDDNLQKAMAVFEAVKAYGIQYEVDPSTPFSEFSENAGAIDYLQFPRQTLQYTNGDCDDLTALYCSLLEAVGVETGFITVPGHIYAAVAMKNPPEEVRKSAGEPADLIFTDEKVWFPVEITLFQDSFEKARQTGAREWREHDMNAQAKLYPTRESWIVYQAVGFKEGASGFELPEREKVTEMVETCISRYVEREIYSRVAELKRKIDQNGETLKYLNQLAVLYARYGLYDRALETFLQIIQRQEYSPALTNTANIYFIRQDYSRALAFYNRALAQNGRNSAALVGVARCNHELENYGLVKQTYELAKEIDPGTAERFAYLNLQGNTEARASAAAELENTVLWEEEE